jgi:SAM-dependent methyltransferase
MEQTVNKVTSQSSLKGVGDNTFIAPDVTFRIANGGVVATNHRAKRHVWLNMPVFQALVTGEDHGPMEIQKRSWFSNFDGLLADPTCEMQNPNTPILKVASLSEATKVLFEEKILISSEDKYGDYFAPKKSMLDKDHFGTFHQQLGIELLLKRRQDAQKWWYHQKFDADTGETKNNLYKFIQDYFLEKYLDTLEFKGKTVLDFGCGSGMASQKFIKRGATVYGMDPDSDLLELASQRNEKNFHPVKINFSDPNPFGSIPYKKLDLVWLADVFLFYFYPQDAGSSFISAHELLAKLTVNLREGGDCVIMQPHGVFWLTPWYGTPIHPFTVLTEYSNRNYSVTPSLQELSEAINKGGLHIKMIHEPLAHPDGEKFDPMATRFAQNFPLWWVFHCVKPFKRVINERN